ncbi:uncharacterized protein LOC115241139 [Formica exsecta]|uniref:uncharacterized protein LOC115241139 n=1 Tax=Formica exsecta TaxID=72781 RepID=UPI001143EE89|nr:uncharacterized protein LOC115241139 [Formica exsecta]
MATIMCLPEEVIAIILGYNDISIEDIINFRCVCKKFRWIVKYDKFWEKKCSQRWPIARKHYDKLSKNDKESQENEQKDKKLLSFMETGINCVRQLNFVFHIINKRYEIGDDISIDFPLCENLTQIMYEPENGVKIYFHIDEIKYLLTQSSQKADCDLAERYRNIKLLHYLREHLLTKEWNRFCEQPHKQQFLERSATIAAQWFQPQKDVSYSCVKASLDNIALGVLSYLREKHPDHPILSTSAENFSYWKNNNIEDNYHWDEIEGTQIINILEEYIFGKLNFRVPKSKNAKVEYKCIDNVLENKIGEEIILFIIYHGVARRLGLRCDIAKIYSASLSIVWQSRCITNRNIRYVRCINIKSGINKLSKCLVAIRSSDMACDLKLLSATKYTFQQSVYRISQSRSQEMKFAVGMIVTHGDHSTDNSTGVIVGWHIKNCSYFVWPRPCSDYNTIEQRIYYIILSENNEICYVEEDAISLTTPKWINNDEIGRYFRTFKNTHYVPNEKLAECYPQDAAITARIFQN